MGNIVKSLQFDSSKMFIRTSKKYPNIQINEYNMCNSSTTVSFSIAPILEFCDLLL